MILRDYLYVDVDKVRAFLAQIDGGVFEESRETKKSNKNTGAGVKGIGLHERAWGTEESLSKSLGDALFPTLEESLEVHGIISDISNDLRDRNYWTSDGLRNCLPPGSIVRLSARGALFDARYVASTLAAFVASYEALRDMGLIPERALRPEVIRQHSKRNSAGGSLKKKPQSDSDPRRSNLELERMIVDFAPHVSEGDGATITPEYLRAIIKISRGMFTPGLHLNLMPTDDDNLTVSVRLKEGQAYLDSDAEMLFARYGVGVQEWTVVGVIGYYAEEHYVPMSSTTNLLRGLNQVHRAKTASYLNSYMGAIGSYGFVDMAQYPGFTIIPLAVYRSIAGPGTGTI